MHPLSGGYGGYGLENQQSPQEAGSPQDPNAGGNGAVADAGQNGSGPNYSDINQILDQILNITDQSLDEAQVVITLFWHSFLTFGKPSFFKKANHVYIIH